MNATLAKLALPRPTEPAPPVRDPAVAAFFTVVDRLETVIELETDALTRQQPLDMVELNRQKRQGMLELSRLMRSVAATRPDEAVSARLAKLSASLERNRLVLDVQLQAVREIAEIIAKVMRDAESDGTYSMRAGWQ